MIEIIIDFLPLTMLLTIAYLTLAFISHYEGLGFGSVIPKNLCIFCLVKDKRFE